MFNDIIVRNFSNPDYALELEDATDTITLGNPVCGDRINVQLLIRGDIVERVAYAAWGCATSLATGNIFCSYIDGLSATKIKAIDTSDIETLLGELDPSQYHCLEMLQTLFEELQALLENRRNTGSTP